MKTLNQLIKVFSDFASTHGQINSFGVGDLWEAGMSQELQYPLLWIQPVETRSIKGKDLSFKVSSTTFRVFILDRVKVDESNEEEVLSDMTQVGHDLLLDIDLNPTFLSGNYTLNQSDVAMEYVTEKLKDEVSGVFMTMVFAYPFAQGCSTPLNS